MTYTVHLRPEAEQDLTDAALWYERQRSGLGNEFLDEVLSTFSTIAQTPFIYPTLHRNTRRAITNRFPFGVYYRVNEADIIIIAVMHGSRNPHHWKSRE